MIFFWTAVALGIGAVVAFIAREKGRSPMWWAFYGTVAPIIALPHVLMARPANEEAWSPVRFGIPEPEHPCPHCGSIVRGEAIVCRHCHKPLYEARSVAQIADESEERADGKASENSAGAKKARADEGALKWLDETFSKFNETADEASTGSTAGEFRADPYARVTDPEPDEQRLNVPREPVAAERVRREQVRSEPIGEADEQAAAAARHEAERLAAERAAVAKAEMERLNAERQAAARTEAERLDAERAAVAKAEMERMNAEQQAAARAEAERLDAERATAAKAEVERVNAERLAAARAEAARLEAERAIAARAEAERLEAERLEAERLEAEHAAAARAEQRREPHLATTREAGETHDLKVDPSERLTASVDGEARPAPRVEPGMRLIATSEPHEGHGHHDERTRAPLSSNTRPTRQGTAPKKRDARKVAALAAAAALVGFVVPWAAQYLPFDGAGKDRVNAVPPVAMVPPIDTQKPTLPPSGVETAEAQESAPPASDSQEVGTAKLAPPKLPTKGTAGARPEAKQAEAKQAEAKRAEAKQAEAKRAEAKQAEANKAEATRAEASKAEANSTVAAAPPEAARSEAPVEAVDPSHAPAKLDPPRIEPPAAAKRAPKATPKAAPKARPELARGPSADEFMAMVDRALGGGAKSPERVSDSDPSVGGAGGQLVQVVQERLRDRGFDPGSIDGRTGPRTVQAIRAFQQSVGMKADGRIDMALMERLGIVGQQLHVFGR